MSMEIEMETINFTSLVRRTQGLHESDESWMQWILISLMSGRPLNGWIKKGDKPYMIEVDMKVNGKEVEFSRVVQQLQEKFYDAVEQRALEIIEDKAKKPVEEIEEITDEFINTLHNAVNEASQKLRVIQK